MASRAGIEVVSQLDLSRWSTLGVDMPIGLPEQSPRACDIAARAYIRPRGSCVFPTPPRPCLGAPDHAAAVRLARAATGRGISRQAFFLLPKIGEIDTLLEDEIACGHPDRIIEVHPECTFAMLNGGSPVPPKRTAEGVGARRALLGELGRLVPLHPLRGAAMDDVLDACAVLLSTERFTRGEAMVLGDGAVDGRGRPMRIVV